MNNNNRTPSGVTVNVVDISGLNASALDKYLAANLDTDVNRVAASHKHGYVVVGDDLYALCSEGVGPEDPISADNPYVLEFFPSSLAEDGTGSFGIFPVLSASLSADDLRDLPVVEEVALEDFIRRFGHRLENNYRVWSDLLAA